MKRLVILVLLACANVAPAETLQPGEMVTITCAAPPAPPVCTPPPPPPPVEPPPVEPPPAEPPATGLIFADSFSSGSGNGFDERAFSAGATVSYVTEGCRTAPYCARITWAPNTNDQRAEHIVGIGLPMPSVYVGLWMKFPADYSFTKTTAAAQSTEQKVIILETPGNRTFLNFRGGGTCATFATIVESAPPDAWSNGSKCMPADGLWHFVEFQVDRVPNGGLGRIRAWLDGQVAIDVARATCSGACPNVNEVKVGAYLNGGTKGQSFFIDGVAIRTARP